MAVSTPIPYALLMPAKLRVARATNDLHRVSEMYRLGLGLQVLASFQNHAGFDGVILGVPGCEYHFEFTYEHGAEAPRSPSAEDLIVFYLSSPDELAQTRNQMQQAGFKPVASHNPYWDQYGFTFEDPEAYRVVICHIK